MNISNIVSDMSTYPSTSNNTINNCLGIEIIKMIMVALIVL